MRVLIALVVACAAVGCYHDKYNVNGPKVEEYNLPPNEARYNEPDKAAYRAPPTPKKEPQGPRAVRPERRTRRVLTVTPPDARAPVAPAAGRVGCGRRVGGSGSANPFAAPFSQNPRNGTAAETISLSGVGRIST